VSVNNHAGDMVGSLKKQDTPAQKNWYRDRHQFVLVQRNMLAVTTLICLLVALGSVYTVMQLSPLKSVEPFVIQVDERTGMTEIVTSTTITELSDKEAIDNFYLWRYVRARESLGKTSIYHNDEVVRVHSDRDVYSGYRSEIDPKQNPEGYYALLSPHNGRREVVFTSIIHQRSNDPSSAMKVVELSFEVTEYGANNTTVTFNKIARIEYGYVEGSRLSKNDRLMNPLGFQVQNYNVTDARIGGVQRR